MKKIKYQIKGRVWFFKAYKWIALVILIFLLLCLYFKCCSSDNTKEQNHNESTQEHHVYPNESLGHRPVNPLNERILKLSPRKPRVIDQDKIIELPNDPLNRHIISDLVNVYLMDTIDIENYYVRTKDNLISFDFSPTDTAEVYKRIQFKINKTDKESFMAALRKDTASVKFVTHEWVYKQANISVNKDPDFASPKNSWFYEKIGVFEAWKYTKGNPSIKIAVLDDGFDLEHIELKNKYIQPWNVIDYTGAVYADEQYLSHGTHVSGSIIAEGDNGFGISGIAPQCTLIPIQIADKSGYFTISTILDGLFYAFKNKADIVNLSIALSLGQHAKFLDEKNQDFIRENSLKDEEKLWEEVFEIAKNSNTVIVQAAGNDRILSGVDPMKRSENSIVVGAVGEDLRMTSFTNYGSDVDIYAPGQQIYSTLPNNKMGYRDGTSMASPIVAGAVALIKSYNADLTAREIIQLIKDSVKNKQNPVLDLHEIFNSLL